MCLGIPLDNYSENLCHYYKEHGDLKLPAFFRGRLGKEYRKCLGRDSIEDALKRARELLIRHAGHSRSCPGLVEHVSLIVPATEDIVMHDIPGASPFYSNPALNALLKDALKKVNLRSLSESEALVHDVRRAISQQGPKSLRIRRGERRLTINEAMLHNLGERSDAVFLKTNGLILHISWNHIVQDVTLTNQDKKEESVHDTIKKLHHTRKSCRRARLRHHLLAPAQGPLAYQVLAGRPNPSDSEREKGGGGFFSWGSRSMSRVFAPLRA